MGFKPENYLSGFDGGRSIKGVNMAVTVMVFKQCLLNIQHLASQKWVFFHKIIPGSNRSNIMVRPECVRCPWLLA